MDDLTCTVCSEVYEGGLREPVVLPLCGHTFCRPCLYNLVDVNPSLKCPTCRKKHKGLSVTQLPTNFAVLTLASNQKHKQQKCEMCDIHGDPVRMWCNPCKKPLCGQCLFEGHMTDGHSVVKVQVILMERKQLIEEKASRILRFIEEEKKSLGKEVHSIAHKLAGIYKRSKILTRYAQDTERILKDVRKTMRLKSIIANENKLENLSPLLGITNSEDEENSSSSKEQKSITESATEQTKISINKEKPRTPSPRTHSKRSHVHRSRRKSDLLPLPVSQADNKTLRVDVNNGNDCSKTLKPHASPAEPGSGAEEKILAMEESDTEQEDSLRSSRDEDANKEASSECHMWSLRRCAPGGNKQWPRINWQDFMTQVPAVQLLVPPENPEVTMQLGVRGTILGRIHIRLWGHLRRAQHFLALCLGTFGPSYKGSKFSNVARKGQPGESLVGGRYITETGSISAEGLMEALEWRGKYSGPVTEGVLGGASDGDPKLESFFGICTRDYPEGEYYCPFGEVVSGIEVVQRAVRQDPVTDVIITDICSATPRCKDK